MSQKKNEGILFPTEIRVVGSYTDRLLSGHKIRNKHFKCKKPGAHILLFTTFVTNIKQRFNNEFKLKKGSHQNLVSE